MESVETLIPDNEGNHLVVVLRFYDEEDKAETFRIPKEFTGLDIADISIRKLDLNHPLNLRAFCEMCNWLIEQFGMFSNSVFSFICSTDSLDTNHADLSPEQYRWNLFEYFYKRNLAKLHEMGIESQEIVVGQEGFQTFARVFYRMSHAPLIYVVRDHLNSKYSG